MVKILDFIDPFPEYLDSHKGRTPWSVIKDLKEILNQVIKRLGEEEFRIEQGVAVHRSAIIEPGVTLKGPIIINANCKIGANAYFREGVFLGEHVKIGPSSEIKSSIVCDHTAIAHLNYIGNSIIGSRVNFEAGSIAANHYNERMDKTIQVVHQRKVYSTEMTKFGSLVGDDSKIGANAVLSPGTILPQGIIVKRLELVEQLKR